MEFRNNSGLEFKDISSEVSRTYHFAQRSFTIDEPLKLNVSASGGHRIFDASGKSHYIPAGWLHLEWVAKEDAPHFDF
ncbi:hypothetical protein [Sinorhizobium meliloti]|uniref:hypothetical protein n=1 Tax=Rhizobium meliloti TaxID=382 RepID=UPI0004177BB7|nr:hypothetical protein [Sinorhizobium meliloti]